MKIKIDQSIDYEETQIIIKCKVFDNQLKKLITQIENYNFLLLAKKGSRNYNIQLEKIFYIESIEDKTFIYLEDDVYEVNQRLYELEETLKDTNFIRISKSCILNIDKLINVKALLNGKYQAQLLNNEKIIISRHYVNAFKCKFGLGG